MKIGVLGINYKVSSLVIREQIARAASIMFEKRSDLCRKAILLSTCNRIEIYFSSEDLADTHTQFLEALRREILFPFTQKMYAFFGVECFLHLAKVTSGIDSAIFAECEIQSQVKKTYEKKKAQVQLSADMHFVFQKSLHIGKIIRSKVYKKNHNLSLYQLLLSLYYEHQCQNPEVLFIGNSEINRRLHYDFHRQGIHNCMVATRYPKGLVKGMKYMPFSEIHKVSSPNLVICASKEISPILFPEKANFHPKTLFIDLGVPRNIHIHKSWRKFLLYDMQMLEKRLSEKPHVTDIQRNFYIYRIKEHVTNLYERFLLSRKKVIALSMSLEA